jgi:hypothetical protein
MVRALSSICEDQALTLPWKQCASRRRLGVVARRSNL